eukprot:1949108-Alexandrium_andersonii.AAC.1
MLRQADIARSARRQVLAAAGAKRGSEKIAEGLLLMYGDIHDEEGAGRRSQRGEYRAKRAEW